MRYKNTHEDECEKCGKHITEYNQFGLCTECLQKYRQYRREKMAAYEQRLAKLHPELSKYKSVSAALRNIQRREQHLCIYCGKKLEDLTYKSCDKCRLGHEVSCNSTYYKMVKNSMSKDPAVKEKANAYIDNMYKKAKERYWMLKEQGRCVRCGKPIDGSGICCEACAELRREYMVQRRQRLERRKQDV